MCALRPGIAGRLREHPRAARSIGRFLEHSRVYWFENGGAPELYLSSADWMERNFFRRVEIAFPVLRKQHRRAHPEGPGDPVCRTTANAWELQADGTYVRLSPDQSPPVDSQALLLERYAGLPLPPAPQP